MAANPCRLRHLCIGWGVESKRGRQNWRPLLINRGAPSNLLAYCIPGSLFTRFCLAVLLNCCAYQTLFLTRLASSQFTWFSSSLNLPLDFSGLPHQQIRNAHLSACFSVGTYTIPRKQACVNSFFELYVAVRQNIKLLRHRCGARQGALLIIL